MLSFLELQFLLENYQEKLASRGVSQDIIDYIDSIQNNAERGKAISKVMSNPKLKLSDIKVSKSDDPRTMLRLLIVHDEYGDFHEDDEKRILEADPTPKKDYFFAIAKWYLALEWNRSTKEWKRSKEPDSIRLPEDEYRVRQTLEYYNQNKDRFRTKIVTNYKRFQDLEQEYIDVSGQRSKRQEIRDMKMKGAKKLIDNSEWKVYEITNEEAACYYGAGTQWCTASRSSANYANQYINRTGALYIFINKKTGEKYQADGHFEDFMDENDYPIEERLWSELTIMMYVETGLKSALKAITDFIGEVVGNADPSTIEKFMKKILTDKNTFSYESDRYTMAGTNYLVIEIIENMSIQDLRQYKKLFIKHLYDKPRAAYTYAMHSEKRFPEAEPYIIKAATNWHQEKLVYYAVELVKQRWFEAEPVIKQNIAAWRQYVMSFRNEFGQEEFYENIEKGRVIDAIRQSYGKNVDPLPLVNKFLDPKYVNGYVMNMLKENFYGDSGRDIRSFVKLHKIQEDFFRLTIKWVETQINKSNIREYSTFLDGMFEDFFDIKNPPLIPEYNEFLAKIWEPFTGAVWHDIVTHFIHRYKKRSPAFEKYLLNGKSPKPSSFYWNCVLQYCVKFNYKLSNNEMKNMEKNANTNDEVWRKTLAAYAIEILNKKYPNDKIHTELMRKPAQGMKLSISEEEYQRRYG